MEVSTQPSALAPWILAALIGSVFGCASVAKTPSAVSPQAAAKSGAPVHYPALQFVFPDGFSGTAYILWDPVLGGAPELVGGVKIYRFDPSGVLRIRLRADTGFSRRNQSASDESGTPLIADWDGSNGGRREWLPLEYWHVARTEEAIREIDQRDDDITSDQQLQLEERGLKDLRWTPEHERLADLDPSVIEENMRDPGFVLLSRLPSAKPQLKLIVPDGYFESIWVVADPARGLDPKSVNFSCPIPDNSVLRVRMTGRAFRALADPLVFDRSGRQLWLRRMHGSADGETMKPLFEYLVCPNGEYRKPLQCEHGYVVHALQALGETDLEPVEKPQASLFDFFGPPEVGISTKHCSRCDEAEGACKHAGCPDCQP